VVDNHPGDSYVKSGYPCNDFYQARQVVLHVSGPKELGIYTVAKSTLSCVELDVEFSAFRAG
jgi:hypothetical protein